MPCGHLSLCIICRVVFTAQAPPLRCPVCRMQVRELLTVRPAGIPTDTTDGFDTVLPYFQAESVPPPVPSESAAAANLEFLVSPSSSRSGGPASRAASTRTPGWSATPAVRPPPSSASISGAVAALPIQVSSPNAFIESATELAMQYRAEVQAAPPGTDYRFYAIWQMPPRREDVRGIHASLGIAGYHAILEAAGGFGGGLHWKSFRNFDQAVEAYHQSRAAFDAPARPPFFAWG